MTNVISFLTVTVVKDKQINKKCVLHYEDLNNRKQ